MEFVREILERFDLSNERRIKFFEEEIAFQTRSFIESLRERKNEILLIKVK